MSIKQTARVTIEYIRRHVSRRAAFIGILIVSFASYLLIFAPRTINFSYGSDNCIGQLTLFPKLLSVGSDASYRLSVGSTVDIGGYPVVGRTVCAEPVTVPKVGKTRLSISPFGWVLARKTFVISTPTAPLVSVASIRETIPVAEAVKVPMSAKDIIHDYDLVAGDGRTRCKAAERALECDISRMKLVQGASYAIKVVRQFDDYSETVGEKQVKVLDPVRVEQASIKPDQTVYDKPTAITIQATKAIGEAAATLERVDGDTMQAEKATVSVVDKQITITVPSDLARETKYRLTLTHVKGADGSTLAEPYVLPFELSGGPKVTGVNIGSSGVNSAQTIVVQFNQPIKANQDIAAFLKVSGATANISKSGDRALIQLTNVGACTAFSLAVSKGLVSEYDIVSNQAWQFSSRTRCSTITTIGSSVRGRPIHAYSFGSGANTVVFTGSIHGDELSSKYLMDDWIAHLEAHAPEIPQDRRVVVIPVLNPDGVAAGTRNNSNNVNLNRNFATANWAQDTQLSGGRTEKGAGGSSPLSEPESAALAQYTQALRPRFVATYHSQGSLVNSNDVGLATVLGPRYANSTGYKLVASTQTGEAFGYEVTGTYEDWLAERSIPAILIELPTHTGRYFSRNVDAMWAVVRG